MGAASRRTDPDLTERLFERSYDFQFFQAVRLLGWIYPARKPVGDSALPEEESARFVARISTAFPPSEVHDIERAGDLPARMTVAFMGLTGPQGVLPAHYTELLIERDQRGDRVLAEFLDLFNHRWVSLFYRAWEKHHFLIGRETAVRNGELDRFTHYIFDLIGLGTPGIRGRAGVDDHALLWYAGLIAQRPHSAIALEGILRDYFRVPVGIEQFRGEWFRLADENLSHMGSEGLHNQLGVGAIAGDEVWNQQARFRVRLGPLPLEKYLAFLPGGAALAELIPLTRFFVEDSLEFEIQLVLEAQQVPECRLSDEGMRAPRLGWLGWLKTEKFQTDPGDAVLLNSIGLARAA